MAELEQVHVNAVLKALNVFPTYKDGEFEINSVKCFHIDILDFFVSANQARCSKSSFHDLPSQKGQKRSRSQYSSMETLKYKRIS